MVVDDLNGRRHEKREESRDTRFILRAENEQGDAGRDGRTCPARLNSQARMGTRKYSFFLFS